MVRPPLSSVGRVRKNVVAPTSGRYRQTNFFTASVDGGQHHPIVLLAAVSRGSTDTGSVEAKGQSNSDTTERASGRLRGSSLCLFPAATRIPRSGGPASPHISLEWSASVAVGRTSLITLVRIRRLSRLPDIASGRTHATVTAGVAERTAISACSHVERDWRVDYDDVNGTGFLGVSGQVGNVSYGSLAAA